MRHRNALFAVVRSEDRARAIVERLRAEGFEADEIAVAFPWRERKDLPEGTKVPEGAATGAGVGGLLGGALGWLVAAGVIALPGVGPLVAAGALAAAFGGAAAGVAVGGIAGALAGLGISEEQARIYEGKIREGNILLSVHVDSPKEATLARDVFEKMEAEHIASSAEVKATV